MQKLILDYYINTKDYFLSNLYDFLEVYEHYGVCGKNGEYNFFSKIFLNVQAKSYKEEGYRILKPWNYLYKFFDENTCEEQRFAVVFGYWYGLSEKSCCMIGNKRWKHLSWSILNALLCGMAEEKVLEIIQNKYATASEKEAQLNIVCSKYEVHKKDGNKIKTFRKGDVLIEAGGTKEYIMRLIK